MTEMRERRISHKELTLLAFRCMTKDCGGEIVIDLNNDKQRNRVFRSDSSPLSCHFCGAVFDTAFHKSFQHFRDWVDALLHAKQEIIFCLREPAG